MRQTIATVIGTVLMLAGGAPPAGAQTFGPAFAPHYTFVDLGVPPGVPAGLGAMAFRAADAGTLLVGAPAFSGAGSIYRVEVGRDAAGHVTGFSGSAVSVCSAPFIDGGLTTAPGDVLLYTTWPTNTLGQVRPGSTSPDKTIPLSSVGVTDSTGPLALVPGGVQGAGRLKLAAYGSGGWYDARLVPDGAGTFDLQNVALRSAPVATPEGIAYVRAASPGFTADSVLIASYGSGMLKALEVDANGDPVVSTARDFVTVPGSPYGSAVDPLTGDLFFTLAGSGRVFAVRGFDAPAPEVYCTAKQNSCGSFPAIGSSGVQSAAATSGFSVRAINTRAAKFGLLLYTNDGRGSLPFAGGTLCLDTSPLRRTTPVVDTTGTAGLCDGTLSIDMNAFAAGSLGGNPLAALRVPGTRVDCQFWGRDAAASGALLSDALEYYVRP